MNLKKFSIRAKESLNQDDTFTLYHKRYDIEIGMFENVHTNSDKNEKFKNGDYKKIYFEYQCNPKYSKPTLEDCLFSILSDARCYEDSCNDIQFFADNFGYTSIKIKECIKAFNGCKKAYNDIINTFGKKVYKELQKHFENY